MSKWIVLEDDGWRIVLPETDIKPHGFPQKDTYRAELAGQECPCKPKVYWENKMIVHNSFEDEEKIDKSLSALLKP